jgi:hypothetical protein
MKKYSSKALKLFTVACISATTFIGSGHQAIADPMGETNAAQTIPPNNNPIISNSTNDPELKAYQTLYASLGNGLQGVLGKDSMNTEERKAHLKKFEEGLRIEFNKNSAASKTDNARLIDKLVDEEDKRGVPRSLSVLPPGAEAKGSNARKYSQAKLGNENIESVVTSIGVVYQFSSIQQMSEKAHMLIEKFRPVFSAQEGWKFRSPDDFKNQSQQQLERMRKLYEKMESQNGNNPAAQQRLKANIDRMEPWIKAAEAGKATFTYERENGFKLSIVPNAPSTDDKDSINIHINPSIDPVDGHYNLSVLLIQIVSQPRKK